MVAYAVLAGVGWKQRLIAVIETSGREGTRAYWLLLHYIPSERGLLSTGDRPASCLSIVHRSKASGIYS